MHGSHVLSFRHFVREAFVGLGARLDCFLDPGLAYATLWPQESNLRPPLAIGVECGPANVELWSHAGLSRRVRVECEIHNGHVQR